MITSMLARISWILLAATAVLYGQAPAAKGETASQSPPTSQRETSPQPLPLAFNIPGATGAAPNQEIKIQVVGPSLDQILIVQAKDKVVEKDKVQSAVEKDKLPNVDKLEKIDVELQVSRLLGVQDRRWVQTAAR